MPLNTRRQDQKEAPNALHTFSKTDFIAASTFCARTRTSRRENIANPDRSKAPHRLCLLGWPHRLCRVVRREVDTCEDPVAQRQSPQRDSDVSDNNIESISIENLPIKSLMLDTRTHLVAININRQE